MADNSIFKIAFLASILFHSIFFLTIPETSFMPTRRSLEKIEITYYKIKKEEPKKKKTSSVIRKPIIKNLPKVTKEEVLKPPKEIAKEASKPKVEEKTTVALKKVEEKKFETVIKEEKDTAKKVTYINYYRAVREKIRKYADRNYPKARDLGEGEVLLNFIISSSGELLQIRVVNGKSVKDPDLREIAINSIKDASPFPPFPKGMSQYRITFNLILAFEPKR